MNEYNLFSDATRLFSQYIFEPLHEKTNNLHMRKQRRRISCAVTAQLISAFVFATQIVQILFYLYPKFQASSIVPVCVGPGHKPKLLAFSCTGSFSIELRLISLESITKPTADQCYVIPNKYKKAYGTYR